MKKLSNVQIVINCSLEAINSPDILKRRYFKNFQDLICLHKHINFDIRPKNCNMHTSAVETEIISTLIAYFLSWFLFLAKLPGLVAETIILIHN